MDDLLNKNFFLESISSLEYIINKFLNLVNDNVYNIDDIIIVFDIDDTLITINLLDDYHISIGELFFKKGDQFDEHELDNLDFAILADKVPCEGSKTLYILDYINNHNINMIIISSRRLHLTNATMYNFSKNGILERITKNKFYTSALETTIKTNNSLYMNNILLVSDQSKGNVFKRLLEKMNKSFKIILVIDNTLNKINSFYLPFHNKSHIIGLFYTHIDPSF